MHAHQNIYSKTILFFKSKSDVDYGIPTNEKTLRRGIEANRLIKNEMLELCEVI